jgi:hypothetical protein
VRQRILAAIILSLTATPGIAASVQVIPNDTFTPQLGNCVVIAGRCQSIIVSTTFYVIVHGTSMPQTTGATLGVSFSTVNGVGSLTMTGAALPPTTPSSGQPFNAIVAGPPSPPWTSCSGPNCLVTVLAPTAGTLPSGTVDAFVLYFTTNCPSGFCTYDINIFDDGGDFSWTDTNANAIPATYTQARVCTTLFCVPLPPGLWLLGSALGVLGWMRQRGRC